MTRFMAAERASSVASLFPYSAPPIRPIRTTHYLMCRCLYKPKPRPPGRGAAAMTREGDKLAASEGEPLLSGVGGTSLAHRSYSTPNINVAGHYGSVPPAARAGTLGGAYATSSFAWRRVRDTRSIAAAGQFSPAALVSPDAARAPFFRPLARRCIHWC